MREFIEEAKVVDKRNARLDVQMSTEIARRKKLHDYVEDLKGKIRVYVRVRVSERFLVGSRLFMFPSLLVFPSSIHE